MHLLLEEDQRTAIHGLIEASEFNANDFQWHVGNEGQETLTHLPSGYTFSIYQPTRDDLYRVVYRPGFWSASSSAVSIGSWAIISRHIQHWLENIRL